MAATLFDKAYDMAILNAGLFSLAALLLVACGLNAWRISHRAALNRTLLVLCLLLALSNVAEAFICVADTREECFRWYRIAWFGWSLYPVLTVLTAKFLAEDSPRSRLRWSHLWLFLPALVILVRSQLGLLGISDYHLSAGVFVPVHRYDAWDIAALVHQYGFDLLGLGIIARLAYASGSRRKRRQAAVILIGALLALLLDGFRYFVGSHGELTLLWTLEQLIFVTGLSLAIIRFSFAVPTARLAANDILAQVKDLVVLTGLDDVILQVNPAAQRLLGAPEAALVGRRWHTLLRDDAGRELAGPCVQCCGTPDAHDVLLVAGDALLPIAMSCAAVHDAYGDRIGVVYISTDQRQTRRLQREIQERASAEEELIAADRAKDRFLATLSHELLTPLAVMFVWLRVAKDDPAQAPRTLEVIEDNARHQRRIVEDLLDMSRIIHDKLVLQPERVALAELAAQCVEEYRIAAAQQRLSLTLESPDAPLMVEGDRVRLKQVVSNLLSNAVKCTPADGAITVTLSRRDARACLAVRDTGCGIAPDDLARIFTPFLQAGAYTAAGGLGLGLAIAKGLVELHDGAIAVTSPGLGHGSTFTITLPLDVPDAPAGG